MGRESDCIWMGENGQVFQPRNGGLDPLVTSNLTSLTSSPADLGNCRRYFITCPWPSMSTQTDVYTDENFLGEERKKIGFGDNNISFRKKAEEGMSESEDAMVWEWHTLSLEEKGIRDKMVTKEATVG